ncbi:MAG TPA: sigma-70 family RNA polymerase sigma factor [Verrucomicrobiae bacterium]|jgi:RNA polymerase sigma factor (sigma-70 family)|nr:sigma-70 family RNA polymerase sigma factor [Verrucomicrobiae bacterium]
MIATDLTQTTKPIDAALVAESLHGDRDAFRQIVERYQTLICSLAYGATGNISQSEDMAQETFVAAWKDLSLLREPDKLRAWLCSIVRCRIQKSWRRDGRQPIHNAATLEEVQEAPACEPLPSEQTINREEEAILWRSLEKIPTLYREPLILFYRQHQSVEQVAGSLELSEDAVKQRLSRGRKLLQEEVQSFVEGALRRTAPSQAFSGAVLSALPLATGPAAAASLGVGVKGTAAAKSMFLVAWLGTFGGFFVGFLSQWMAIRSVTPQHQRFAKLFRLIVTWVLLLGIPIAGDTFARWVGEHFALSDGKRWEISGFFWIIWVFSLSTWLIFTFRRDSGLGLKQPPSSGQRWFMAAGSHLTIFGWLIALALREHDMTTAAVITVAMVLLCVWNGLQLTQRPYFHMTLCCAVVIAVINLRLDVWTAASYGVSVAEIHNRIPFWIVPVSTLALVGWVAGMLVATKPKLP